MGAISCSGYGTLQFPERQVYCLAGFSDKTLDTLKQLDADPFALADPSNRGRAAVK